MPEWDSNGKPIRQVQAVDGGPILVGSNQMEPGAIGASQLGAEAVGTTQLADGAVTKAKTKMFISTEQTGTGAAQNIAHGLGVTPTSVLVTPTDLTAATVGQYSATEGVHTSTNVVLTVTSGKKYKVQAWA